MNWQAAARLSEIDDGEIFPVQVGGVDLILLKFEGGVSAYLDACPHEGAQLSFGERAGDVLVCAKHLWEFDVRSGQHISRMRRPEHDLKQAPIRVVGDTIEVDVSNLAA